MDTGLLIFGAVAGQLIAQADEALPEEPSKIAQLLEWLNQHPVMGWGVAIFTLVAMAVAAIAALTGNLDKIFSFKAKYLSQARAELSEQQLTQLRKQLLQQMKTDVASRLKDSLHNLIRVDLEQEEQRHQVGKRQLTPLVEPEKHKARSFRDLIQRGLAVFSSSHDIEPVAPAEKTHTLFHRTDIGRRLLILGEPGAGKTTELLMVAQRLVDAAVEDIAQPIPLIFELSSWEPNVPVPTWLGQQLNKSYGVSEALAERLAHTWIEQAQILPLLDGLDELGQQNQIECIQALEVFLARYPALPTLICCRREDYEQGGEQLKQLNGAIYLQAVKRQQIRQYLQDLNREALWTGIQASPELLKLAQSPLFLTMLVIAYQGKPIQDKVSLFNAYIHKQLHDPSHQGTYKPGKEMSPGQTLHYLSWLAKQLKQRDETEFLIEYLQPDWLGDKYKIQTYRLSGALIGALIFGLIGTLSGGLTVGLIFGLIGALSGGLGKIEPQEQLKWSLKKGLISALIGGLFGGLFGALIGALIGGLIGALIFGLILGLIFGLIGALTGALSNEAIEQKTVPNQGIKESLRNGLILGLIGALSGGLIFGLIFGLIDALVGALNVGLIFGLVGALSGGLMAAIQHFILRVLLTKQENAPWNYALFLEHAARLRFIQRTGGRYRFVHDLLRQHFAQMTPQQQALLAQNSKKSAPQMRESLKAGPFSE